MSKNSKIKVDNVEKQQKLSKYRETAQNYVELSTTHPNCSKIVKNVEKLQKNTKKSRKTVKTLSNLGKKRVDHVEKV